MAAPASASRLLATLLGLVVVPACATGDGMQNKLYDATAGYNRALRWGDYDRAAEFLPGPSQPPFLEHHDEYTEELVIVDYELTRLDLDKESGIAASRAEITWHTDRRLIVETTSVDQLWQWHEGRFVLVDERRAGGTPLAIFAETEEQDHPYLPGLKAYREAYDIGKEDAKGKKGRRRARAKEPTAPSGPASAAAMALDAPPAASPDRSGS